jgi:hypothetical protein
VQIGTLPCGKTQFIAVGVTVREPRLHALATASKPDVPLVMQRAAWEALRKSAGLTAVPTWACGDHGSEVRTEGDIRVRQQTYTCPTDGSTERLIREEDWNLTARRERRCRVNIRHPCDEVGERPNVVPLVRPIGDLALHLAGEMFVVPQAAVGSLMGETVKDMATAPP